MVTTSVCITESVEFPPELGELGIQEVRRVCDRMWILKRRRHFNADFSVERASSQWRETACWRNLSLNRLCSAPQLCGMCMAQQGDQRRNRTPGMAITQRYPADRAAETAVSVGLRGHQLRARVVRTVPPARNQLGQTESLSVLGPVNCCQQRPTKT